VVQNPDGRPLNELLDLLQSEVMPAQVLLGAEAEREAIENQSGGRAETFKALRSKAPSPR